MMMKQPIFVLAIVLLTLRMANAQEDTSLVLTAKDSMVTSGWIAGLGYNFIDDSGQGMSEFFDFESAWNGTWYPNRFNFGYQLKSGLAFEAIAAINTLKEGKIVDNRPLTEDIDYFSIDVRAAYHFNHLLYMGFFDPYVGVGLGYTDTNHTWRPTFNATVGARAWLNDNWGIDVNSSGKWSLGEGSNHKQHAIGVVYRFGEDKVLTKKGEEKKAAILAENQRVQDSINAAEEQRQEALRRAQEEEAARLAAEEKAKEEAERKRKEELLDMMNELGNVNFAFDSADLDEASRYKLDKLADLWQQYPGNLSLSVGSHTDTRGPEAYNMKLSERRLKSTVDYLVSKGIPADKINGMAYGETQPLNICPCTEEEHKENRRSEFREKE